MNTGILRGNRNRQKINTGIRKSKTKNNFVCFQTCCHRVIFQPSCYDTLLKSMFSARKQKIELQYLIISCIGSVRIDTEINYVLDENTSNLTYLLEYLFSLFYLVTRLDLSCKLSSRAYKLQGSPMLNGDLIFINALSLRISYHIFIRHFSHVV